MLKKISLCIVLAATANLAFADSTYHKHHRHSHHAVESYKGEVAVVPAPVVVNNFPTSFYLGASAGSRINYVSAPGVYTGLEGTLFGGYGGLLNEYFYLAGELGVGDSAVISNYSGTSGSVRSTWNVALSILPGYLLTPDSLLYLRAGIGSTHFSAPDSNSTTGLLGLGLQVAVCPNWDIRGEYIYGFYRNMSIGTPRSQQFNLGAVYKFL